MLLCSNLQTMRTDKINRNFKLYSSFNKSLCQTVPSVWKCPKTHPLTNWKFEPSPRTHKYSDPIINKHSEQVNTTYGFIMTCIELHDTGQNSLSHWKTRFGYPWFSKKFQTHRPRLLKARWNQAQFQKGHAAYPLQNYVCLFPAYLWVRQFWPQV